MRARRQASESALVVVNHALLALSGEVEGLLPDFDVLIVDEAHRLEGVLLSQLERSVSRHRFEEALRMLGSARARGGSGGLIARLGAYTAPLLRRGGPLPTDAADTLADLAARMSRCRDDVDRLFERLTPAGPTPDGFGGRVHHHSALELLGRDLAPLQTVLEHCAAFSGALQRLATPLESAGEAGSEHEKPL